jgi:hypothetical protein
MALREGDPQWPPVDPRLPGSSAGGVLTWGPLGSIYACISHELSTLANRKSEMYSYRMQ